jgi:hypothetical protein
MAELEVTDAEGVAELAELEQLLQGAGVFGSMDPAEVNTPGYWLALDEVRPRALSGQLQLRCSVFLIAGDRDARRAVAVLAGLFNKVRTVLTPDGPVTTQGVVLPDSSTPLPALRVPVHINTGSE